MEKKVLKNLDWLVLKRRKTLRAADTTESRVKLPAGASDKWGLAFSGGGIRSATFVLGLVSAMSSKKMLTRFDLMSTVSGGGYAGATIGRLFDRARKRTERVKADAASSSKASEIKPEASVGCASSAAPPVSAMHRTAAEYGAERAAGRAVAGEAGRDVEKGLGSPVSTWTIWWLRANGRYLIPSGMLDLTFVVALYVRNVLAIHFEIALLALVGGIILALVNTSLWSLLALGGWVGGSTFLEGLRWLSPWLPVSWLLLAVLILLAAIQISAFWCFPYVRQRKNLLSTYIVVFVSVAAVLALLRYFDTTAHELGSEPRKIFAWGTTGLMLAWLAGAEYARRTWIKAKAKLPDDSSAAAEVQSVLTQHLAKTFRCGVILLGLGVIERFAWHLAFEPSGFDIVVTGGLLAVLAPALRAALPYASRLTESTVGVQVLTFAARLVGYGAMALLGAFWISLAYRAVLSAYFADAELSYTSVLGASVFLLLPMVIYISLTGRNLEFLNLSSLHSFYRARLVRSYLGAANERRFDLDSSAMNSVSGDLKRKEGTLGGVPRSSTSGRIVSEIDEVHLDDDVGIHDYRPMDAGGPIHLINMCVNQTNDPRGGVFNRDRQGLLMTVVAGGHMRVGAGDWMRLRAEKQLSLGTLVAISGAAVAPAAGSFTRGGISALAMFAGLRLGYWWTTEQRQNAVLASAPKSILRRKLSAWTGKSGRILNELRGRFQGTDGPDWFLTDGGHFENTGAYALLAERCRVIVVSDASADPRYGFNDLENLVRKARIDLNADIRFMRPRDPPDLRLSPPAAILEKFGTIDDLASSKSNACIALAKIIYAESPSNPGILIYVKPNFFVGLPVDLVNFKAANPSFPQESTSDQSFSEAQWESYFLLGQEMGKSLSIDQLACIADAPDAYFVEDKDTTLDEALKREAKASPTSAPTTPMQAISRIPARIAVSTVKATIGLTAIAAFGATVWQVVETWRGARDNSTAIERTTLASLTDLWLDSRGAQTHDESYRLRAPSDPRRIEAVSKLAATLLYTADRLCSRGEVDWFVRPGLARDIATDTLAECDAVGSAASKSCSVLLQSVGSVTSRTINACLGPLLETPPQPRAYWAYDYTAKQLPQLLHPCDENRVDASLRTLKQPNEIHVDLPDSRCPKEGEPLDFPGAAKLRVIGSALDSFWKSVEFKREETWLSAMFSSPSKAVVSDPANNTVRRVQLLPAQYLTSGTKASFDTFMVAAHAGAVGSNEIPHEQVQINATPACRNVTIFIQVYDQETARSAEALRLPWQALGARVPSIDNVQESAKTRGRSVLAAIQEPTVRYHRSDAAACASYLWPAASQVLTLPGPITPRLLSARFPSAPFTIEVWLPPQTAISPRTVAPTSPR